MSKKLPKFVTSCCGKDIEDCPGCKENTVLIPQDGDSMDILKKIDEGTVTIDDFNKLIQEAMPESVRDRVRRRTVVNATGSHIDNATGHQKISLPNFTKRTAPKRERSNNTQMTGAGKAGHRRSTRTQRRKAKKSLSESIQRSALEPFTKMVEEVGKSCSQILEILSNVKINGTIDANQLAAIKNGLRTTFKGSKDMGRLFLTTFDTEIIGIGGKDKKNE